MRSLAVPVMPWLRRQTPRCLEPRSYRAVQWLERLVLKCAGCNTSTGHYVVAGASGEQTVDANRFLHSLDLRGLSPQTRRSYAHDLVLLLRWLAKAGRSLESICEADLLGLIEEGRQRKLSPRSFNRWLSTCRLYFRFVTGRDVGAEHGGAPGLSFRGRRRDRKLGVHTVSRQRRNTLTAASLVKWLVALVPPAKVHLTIADEIAAGHLVRPFASTVPGNGYHLLMKADRLVSPHVALQRNGCARRPSASCGAALAAESLPDPQIVLRFTRRTGRVRQESR